MTTVGVHDNRRAALVYRSAIEANRRCRLDGNRDHDVLSGRNAAENAASVIRQEPFRRHLVGVLRALLRDCRESRADFDTFDRVDAHHRVCDVGVELVVDGLTPADGNAGCDDLDARTA